MRFNRCRSNIACSFVSGSSGSPENRTQHYAVISRVWATSPRLPFQSGTPESNREPPAPKAGVLPSAPLPVCLQSERPDLNRRSPGPRTRSGHPAIPGFATFCRRPRVRRSQWVGRCSNPRLLVFSQVLHRLSYRPEQKKPGVFCDTGLWQKSRYFDGRVSQAPVAHGEGIRRLTGEMPACISVRECNSTARTSFLASPPLGRPHRRWGLLSVAVIRTRQPARRFARILAQPPNDKTLERADLFPTAEKEVRRPVQSAVSSVPHSDSPPPHRPASTQRTASFGNSLP